MANILRESQVEKYIMSPPTGSMVIEITPQVAEFMLVNTNHKNRPLSLGTVSKYQAEMEKNNWSLTGDSIKFGTDGLLKDGQHRLGKKRGAADTLAMMGVPNYKHAFTIIRMIISYEVGMSDTPKNGVTNDYIKHKYLEEIDHDLLQEAVNISKLMWKTTKWQTGVIGAFFYMAVKHGQREQITKFFDDMSKGIGSKPRSPIPFLLQNVNRMRMDRAYHLRAHQYSIMLSRAYANYKAGRSSTKKDITVSLKDKMEAF